MAQEAGEGLGQLRLGVASGLARGIDWCAHKGALSSATGATIRVLGCGIDVVYPEKNKKIAEEITRRGAIITEFSLGTFPLPQNFPIRTRIIAGMSSSGGRRIVLQLADYSPAGHGIRPRCIRSTRPRDATFKLWPESAYKAGC
jgi:DNA processing protein